MSSRRDSKADGKGDETARKRLTFRERLELDGLFERIEAAEAEVEELQARLADPATYKRRDVDVSQLGTRLEVARQLSDELLARWEELEARRD